METHDPQGVRIVSNHLFPDDVDKALGNRHFVHGFLQPGSKKGAFLRISFPDA
jgi:hypothetical protein